MNMNTLAKFLFVMDPYETLNLETETSLLLMQELISRGHGDYWLQQEGLALVHNQPMGLVFPVTGAEPLQRAEPVWSNLNDFAAISPIFTRVQNVCPRNSAPGKFTLSGPSRLSCVSKEFFWLVPIL